MSGQIDVLNCGTGHTEIRFDKDDPVETARAQRIIKDMLRRGYALFVEGKDKKLCRVEQFMEDEGVYIIADGPEIPPEAVPLEEKQWHTRGRGRPRKAAVPVHSAKAVAIGRSAGG